jgi:uncharacterized protein involved in outer membrane biogenesis
MAGGTPPWTRLRRGLGVKSLVLLVAVLLFTVARLLLPAGIKLYANDKLAEIVDYRGSIDDVGVSLLTGGYSFQGMEIVKTAGQVPVPFFSARRIDFTLEPSALLDGVLVAEVTFHQPHDRGGLCECPERGLTSTT